MRPALLLLAGVALSGCTGDDAPQPAAAAKGYTAEVRQNFLTSCLENATNTANGAATEEQLSRTCECILGRVEAEYSETEFADFEKRLLGGEASSAENDRLVGWSTDCAEAATR